MSYSSNLKMELLEKEINNKEEIFAELFGLFSSKSNILSEGIFYRTENISLAKRVYSNLKKVTKLLPQLSYVTSKKLGIHKIYHIIVRNNLNDEEEYAKLISKLLSHKTFSVVKDENKVKGIIRGFFLNSGYIKDPKKGYSLDFFIDTEDAATFLYFLFRDLQKKVFQTDKKNKHIVYLRNSEDILDVIIMMGGINSFFSYEEVTINKEIRNKINRTMNYEIANETKKITTSDKQIEMIEFIEKEIGLNSLTDVLKEAAYARLENEYMSLQELAEKLNISKSGVRNRFRRIEAMYNKLIDEGSENES